MENVQVIPLANVIMILSQANQQQPTIDKQLLAEENDIFGVLHLMTAVTYTDGSLWWQTTSRANIRSVLDTIESHGHSNDVKCQKEE